MGAEPDVIPSRLTEEITGALGEELRGLYVHGSWVGGDFASGRSDLDLLSVLRTEPTAHTLKVLEAVDARIDRDHPEWIGRIEVAYLTTKP